MPHVRRPKPKRQTPQPLSIPDFPPPPPQPIDVLNTDGMVAVQEHESAQVRLELSVLPAMSGVGTTEDNSAEIVATTELAGEQIWYLPPGEKAKTQESPDPKRPRLCLTAPVALVAPPVHLSPDEHNQAVTRGASVVYVEYLEEGALEDVTDLTTDECAYPRVTPSFPQVATLLSQAQDAPDGAASFAEPDSSPVQLPPMPPAPSEAVATETPAPTLATKVEPAPNEPVPKPPPAPKPRSSFTPAMLLLMVCVTAVVVWWLSPSPQQPDVSVTTSPSTVPLTPTVNVTASQAPTPPKDVTRVVVSGVGARPMCTAECTWGDLNADGMPLTKNGRKTIVCGAHTYTATVTRSTEKHYCWNATNLELVADSNTPADNQTR